MEKKKRKARMTLEVACAVNCSKVQNGKLVTIRNMH
jgi:hypothetical protein